MLPKTNRASFTKIDKNLLNKGTRHNLNLFSTVTFFDTKNTNPKIIILVGKKTSLLATVRNRIKRRMSEAVCHEIGNFPQKSTTVFYIKKTILEKNYKDIASEIGRFVILLTNKELSEKPH